MTLYVYPRQRQDIRIRIVTLTAGVGLAALGLIVGSLLLGALGVGLLVAGCLLFVREVRLVHAAMSPPSAGAGQMDHSEVETTLERLLKVPAVADAWSAAPERFEQVNYLDQFTHGAWPKAEVPQYVYVQKAYGEWSIAFADELFANIDLDAEETIDPMCQVLRSDPRIIEVWRGNREGYTVEATADLTVEAFAVLAVKGLLAHHLDARRRLRGG